MSKSISLAVALAIATGVTLSSVSISTPAMAYACKSHPVQTVGVRKLKFKAHKVARIGWQNYAKTHYGQAWSVWQIAKSKVINCSKISTNQGKKWRCLASAKPCKYVVQ